MVTRRFRFCSRKYREPLEKVAIHGKREGGKAESLHARLHVDRARWACPPVGHAPRFPSMGDVEGRPLSRLAGNRFARSYQH